MKKKEIKIGRILRHKRVRKRVIGTKNRPRLAVFRSLKQIYAQLIDDQVGCTLVEASTLSEEVGERIKGVKGKLEKGKIAGIVLAERALAKGIKEVVFDKGGYLYHGRVKALAEGAREGGLKF